MKADLEDLGNLKYRMSVEVDLDQLREMRRRLARAYSSRVNLRGFRPGHAPLEMVMRQLGPALEVEAREAVVGETLGKALEEKKLKPSTEPKVEIGEDGPGGEVRYTAEFEAFPIMEPKDYLGVEVEEPTLPPITEETVDEVG
ncbi:MAG: trigger factor family protein, partial [Deltaproteobacteria bacterium]|nr:trigger factor family protein [Deltaproteobacteria bacterium]